MFDRHMKLFVVAVIAGAGCDQVFELRDRGEGLPPTPICLAPGDLVDLPLLADTYLVDGDPTPNGAETIARVAPGSSLLVRFDSGSVAFEYITLTLSHADSAVGCDSSDGCVPCALGTVGSFAAFLTRPDWDEQAATHADRKAGTPWTAPGATGADRSARLNLLTYMGGAADLSSGVFTMKTLFDPTWPPGLSLLVASDLAAPQATFGTREGAEACGRVQPPKVVATCLSASTCGNRMQERPEECDDGNVVGGDGCSAACLLEVCGNGRLDPDEDCDDGNLTAGDSCSPSCMCELQCPT